MALPTENDAAGGAGSIPRDLLGILTSGVSRVADSYLSRKYPLTSGQNQVTQTAQGEIKPAAAPQQNTSATAVAASFFDKPEVKYTAIAIAAAVGVLIIVKLVK